MKGHVLCFLIITLTACSTLQTVKKMKSKRATVSEWRAEDKIVLFIPMIHIANPDFYKSVRTIIESKKAEGFIVYYEGTKWKDITDNLKKQLLDKPYLKYYRGAQHIDSICQFIYEKKLNKFIGFVPDSALYQRYIPETGFFSGMVAQPSPKELGLDLNDKNVDVGNNDLVDMYEKRFGEIILTEADFTIMPNSTYPKSLRLPKANVKSILINYRNEYLAQRIQGSADKKILVLFGMAHMEGTLEQLRNLDKSWRKL